MIKRNQKIGLWGLSLILIFLIIPAQINGSLTDTLQVFESGVLDLKYKDKVVGKMVYKSISDNSTAVTTLEPDYGGIAPFHPYFAQSLKIDNSEYFLSNTIAGFELFEDLNGNGYIDSTEEIKYFVQLNATQGFTFGDILKTINSENITYSWTSSYFDIDGFLEIGEGEPLSSVPPGTYTTSGASPLILNSGSSFSEKNNIQQFEIIKTIISSFNISYTVKETGNYTDLSIKYDIGSWDAFTFEFDEFNNEIRTGTIDLTGLGLSILFTSVIRSSLPVERLDTSVNGGLSGIKILASDEVLFEAELDESYTLNGDSEPIPVKTVIAPIDTFLENQNLQWVIFEDYLENIRNWYFPELNLPGIPAQDIPNQEVFNYRISYPNWSGGVINHDPTYRINKFGFVFDDIFNFPTTNTSSLVVISTITGLLMVGIVVLVEKRKLI